jgi:hypothetical protein
MFKTLTHYAALEHVIRERCTFDVADLHAALHKVRDDDITLQTMVFEPRMLRLHLAIGTIPASEGELKAIDLGPFLQQP